MNTLSSVLIAFTVFVSVSCNPSYVYNPDPSFNRIIAKVMAPDATPAKNMAMAKQCKDHLLANLGVMAQGLTAQNSQCGASVDQKLASLIDEAWNLYSGNIMAQTNKTYVPRDAGNLALSACMTDDSYSAYISQWNNRVVSNGVVAITQANNTANEGQILGLISLAITLQSQKPEMQFWFNFHQGLIKYAQRYFDYLNSLAIPNPLGLLSGKPCCDQSVLAQHVSDHLEWTLDIANYLHAKAEEKH